MVYKFTQLSRSEVEAMLGLSLQETRFYQEAKEDGRQEGKQEGREETLQQVVANLLNEGMTVEAIARITGLSSQQVQDLGTIAARSL